MGQTIQHKTQQLKYRMNQQKTVMGRSLNCILWRWWRWFFCVCNAQFTHLFLTWMTLYLKQLLDVLNASHSFLQVAVNHWAAVSYEVHSWYSVANNEILLPNCFSQMSDQNNSLRKTCVIFHKTCSKSKNKIVLHWYLLAIMQCVLYLVEMLS